MGGGGSPPPSRWHILSKADVSEYTRHRLLQAAGQPCVRLRAPWNATGDEPVRKRKVITLILLGVFLAGLSLLLYPSVSSYWNSITQSRAIVDYDTIVKSLSPKDYTAYFERAEEYNSELKALPFPLTEYQQISGYDDCLNAAGDGVIGYIDIDNIQSNLV